MEKIFSYGDEYLRLVQLALATLIQPLAGNVISIYRTHYKSPGVNQNISAFGSVYNRYEIKSILLETEGMSFNGHSKPRQLRTLESRLLIYILEMFTH